MPELKLLALVPSTFFRQPMEPCPDEVELSQRLSSLLISWFLGLGAGLFAKFGAQLQVAHEAVQVIRMNT